MKNSMPAAIAQLWADLTWQFDTTLELSKEPDFQSFLERLPSPEYRPQLLADLIRCELGHHCWQPDFVAARLQMYEAFDASEEGRASLLEGIYSDRVEMDQCPTLDEFVALGVPIEHLRLRTDDDRLALGDRVGAQYQVVQRLGQGAFGLVYRAMDLTSSRQVAIKTAQPGLDVNAAVYLIDQEAQSLKTLQCSGIPKFLEHIHETDGPGFLVIEYLEGPTLAEVARSSISPSRAAAIVAALCETLDTVHRQGYVHRDVKPANVILADGDRPQLFDFGLAIMPLEAVKVDGQIAGTRGYMPVQSLLGMSTHTDGRTDVFSLGAILYELLAGEPPTTGEHREDHVVAAILAVNLGFPDQVPMKLQDICQKSLARNPNDRYDTASEMAADLRRFLGGDPKATSLSRPKCRLLAWRVGRKLGDALVHIKVAIRGLQANTDMTPQSPAKQTVSVAAQMAAGMAMGAAIYFQECLSIAKQLGYPLEPLEQDAVLAKSVYQPKTLAGTGLDTFRNHIEAAWVALQHRYAALSDFLAGQGPAIQETYDFGVCVAGCSFGLATADALTAVGEAS